MDYNKIALGCDHVGFQMKEQIRAEDIAAGVFIPVSGMPEIVPQIGVPR